MSLVLVSVIVPSPLSKKRLSFDSMGTAKTLEFRIPSSKNSVNKKTDFKHKLLNEQKIALVISLFFL
tara:strand:- start:392 stop:592 length:201 start_codon:yes stop_codon:yes gene_type:complete